MRNPAQGRRSSAGGEAVRRRTRLVALTLGLVGIAGFVPGVTSHLGQIEPAGWGSGALLFGVVRVSVIGNLIHVAMSAGGLLATASDEWSRRFLQWGGTAYATMSCYRVLLDLYLAGGRVPGQGAGEWLPVAAGLAIVAIGLFTPGPSKCPTR